MKRINLLFMSLLCVWISATAQVGQQSQEPVDSIKNIGYMDSLFQELPEVMIIGERPIVKAEQGKLVYDVPRLVGNLPVDNAYDVVKNLPGIVNMNNSLMLGGQEVTVVINGKVTTLSAEQLDALLKSIPVSRIEKAEVMYSAPARYQVRGPMINLILAPGTGQASSLQGELYTAFNQHHYESLAERGSLLYSGRKFSADLLYSYSYDRDRRITEKEALHTLADGSVHQMDMDEIMTSRTNSHQIRLGMDYSLAEDHLLSLVYTTAFTDSKHYSIATGAQNSVTDSQGDSQLHNAKLDYQTPFGLKAEVAFTSYHSPGSQLLYSTMGTETMNFLSRDKQQINQWRFYAGQEHTLGKGWGLNNVGLNMFIAVVGIAAGPSFIAGFKEVGVSLFIVGALATAIPLLAGLLMARYLFKFHPALSLGCTAGARTTTAALGAIQDAVESDTPALGYTVTYAVGNTLLIIWGVVIVLLM